MCNFISFTEYQVEQHLHFHPAEESQLIELFTRNGGHFIINTAEFFQVFKLFINTPTYIQVLKFFIKTPSYLPYQILHFEPGLAPELLDEVFYNYDWSAYHNVSLRTKQQRSVLEGKWNDARRGSWSCSSTTTYESGESEESTDDTEVIVTPWSDSE